jgi:hypothetical protein
MDRLVENKATVNVSASRQHPRFQANSKIRLHWTDWSNDCDVVSSCEGICTDVAIGGIGVYSVNDFAVSDVLGVEFIDAPLPIYQARVIYRNGYDYGLEFLNMV